MNNLKNKLNAKTQYLDFIIMIMENINDIKYLETDVILCDTADIPHSKFIDYINDTNSELLDSLYKLEIESYIYVTITFKEDCCVYNLKFSRYILDEGIL